MSAFFAMPSQRPNNPLRARWRHALLCLITASVTASSWGAPAAWYRWRSKLNGTVVCRQTSPGPGWELDSGPHTTHRCA